MRSRTRLSGGTDDLTSYKILVVGEHGTGKTSYITRLVTNAFGSTQPTLGVDYREKLVHIDGIPIMLQLCDISGREKNLNRIYYQHSRAALVFYDKTNLKSFAFAATWKANIDANVFGSNGLPIPCVMVGGKADLPCKVQKTKAEWLQFCQEARYFAHFNVSSKSGFGVTDSLEFVAASLAKEDVEANLSISPRESIRSRPVSPTNSQRSGPHSEHGTVDMLKGMI